MIITLKATGRLLYVVGAAPRKAGDRFRASDAPEERGCVGGMNAQGGYYFSCRRGGSATVRDYVFDPAKHAMGEAS